MSEPSDANVLVQVEVPASDIILEAQWSACNDPCEHVILERAAISALVRRNDVTGQPFKNALIDSLLARREPEVALKDLNETLVGASDRLRLRHRGYPE